MLLESSRRCLAISLGRSAYQVRLETTVAVLLEITESETLNIYSYMVMVEGRQRQSVRKDTVPR